MTAEQLEDLAGGANPVFMDLDHEEIITHLAKCVLAAENLVEALKRISGTSGLSRDAMICKEISDNALSAYREACK